MGGQREGRRDEGLVDNLGEGRGGHRSGGGGVLVEGQGSGLASASRSRTGIIRQCTRALADLQRREVPGWQHHRGGDEKGAHLPKRGRDGGGGWQGRGRGRRRRERSEGDEGERVGGENRGGVNSARMGTEEGKGDSATVGGGAELRRTEWGTTSEGKEPARQPAGGKGASVRPASTRNRVP